MSKLWASVRNHCRTLRCWLSGGLETPEESQASLSEKLTSSLTELSVQLDQPTIKNSISTLPDQLMMPVLEGLERALSRIKDSLNQLQNQQENVTNIDELLDTLNALLETEQLTSTQEDTADEIKTLIETLQEFSSFAEIEAVLPLIDNTIAKLEEF